MPQIPSFMLVIILHLLEFPRAAQSAGSSTNTLAPMWTRSLSSAWDARAPIPDSFALCVLQSESLTTSCSGTYPTLDPPTNPMIALTSGANFTCGILYESGQACCWGDPIAAVPTSLFDVHYSSFSAGHGHICAIRNNSKAMDCWGTNEYQQLNFPSSKSFVQVSSGYDYSCGLESNGEVQCWGWDRAGSATIETRSQPASAVFSSIFAGGTHSCGIEKSTGAALCWGWNNFRQCDSPASVAFVSLALGLFHSCGILRSNGSVLCWGDNGFNQTDSPREEPYSILAAADYYTCGVSLKDPGKVRCWGNSVDFKNTSIRASLGLCKTGQKCGSQEYELLSARCLAVGDRMCLNCFADNPNCSRSDSAAPSPRLGGPPSSSPGANLKSKSGNRTGVAIGASIAIVIFLSACVLLVFIIRRRRVRSRRRKLGGSWAKDAEEQDWRTSANRLISFSSSDLIKATKSYSPNMILGQGSCGIVYKAVLPNGQELALKKSRAGDQTLVKELRVLARVHHTHLVNLVGYCSSEQLLAFEFMGNGSLFDCLFRMPKLRLGWSARLKIGAQAARGLEYLHLFITPQILHRDVKSSNILLDRNWNAHISDFGFSRSADFDSFQALHMTLVGTPGYMDPEALQTGKLTSKSDVYSFGVVLLELLTGRQAMMSSSKSLVGWIQEQGMEQRSYKLVFDPRVFAPDHEITEILEDVMALALKCVSLSAMDRPNMSAVASRLERALTSVNETRADSEPVGSTLVYSSVSSSTATDSSSIRSWWESPPLPR